MGNRARPACYYPTWKSCRYQFSTHYVLSESMRAVSRKEDLLLAFLTTATRPYNMIGLFEYWYGHVSHTVSYQLLSRRLLFFYQPYRLSLFDGDAIFSPLRFYRGAYCVAQWLSTTWKRVGIPFLGRRYHCLTLLAYCYHWPLIRANYHLILWLTVACKQKAWDNSQTLGMMLSLSDRGNMMLPIGFHQPTDWMYILADFARWLRLKILSSITFHAFMCVTICTL